MTKALIYSGYVVAALLVLIFGMDLATGIPFKRSGVPWDVGAIICALLLVYLSWSTMREQS
jgi:NADH:ubiquinone oxidoreductase subunit 6 (subunit J)